MIKAVDENLSDSKDENTFTSLNTDANQPDLNIDIIGCSATHPYAPIPYYKAL